MEYTSIKVFSKKLNKEIELYGYEQDGVSILSTSSLKQIFSEIKSEFGLEDSYEEKIHMAGSEPHYIVNWTLRDKDGYSSMFMGETNSSSLKNEISKQYPFIMALNRAMACGIISYLQLPGKYYSDSEIENEHETTLTPVPTKRTNHISNKPNAITQLMDKKREQKTEEKEKVRETTITSAPELPLEDSNEVTNEPETTKEFATSENSEADTNTDADAETSTNVEEESLPFGDEPINSKETNISENEEVPVDSTPNQNSDIVITFGKLFEGNTVSEVAEMYHKKDTNAMKFVKLCLNGTFNNANPEKAEEVKREIEALKSVL